ncbi:short-subunit dehydrogenase [Enterococcus sp. PF1-24]|uniref:SDR family oxidoreductase n=1 Tax=unclassified Enterococcus TaxID=2608891 RepID=UPI002475D8DC|nr:MULTISPECIES: SDR family oxidoreductase [unclassified Enterococcus]MDH6364172.1 short-subunit dehydrogenase [Enterococcus sp. PFB1-1]MDH6401273.1 short-subunit dehydrogenase [Enterococcus sp. PF1-24]
MKTVFITGASSGIGKQTAKLFQSKGWNVIATMRNPQEEIELSKLDNLKVLQCDVTDTLSIKNAVKESIEIFGGIDVLVNNAGYYTLGAFETFTDEQINQQINTNLLGLIQVTKEVVPYFRKQKSGVIVNVSSIAGLISIPLQSLYHATKWGVEGFSESLQYELQPFNVQVKIIEPGVIKTNFYGRSMTMVNSENIEDYKSYSEKVMKNILKNGEKGSEPFGVAETIYKASTDNRKKLRYPTGNSKNLTTLRSLLPKGIFISTIKKVMEK